MCGLLLSHDILFFEITDRRPNADQSGVLKFTINLIFHEVFTSVCTSVVNLQRTGNIS